MHRRLFRFGFALSLLLFATTLLLWARSIWTIDEIFYAKKGGNLWRVKSYGGIFSTEIVSDYRNDEWLWASYPYAPGAIYDSNAFVATTQWWGGSFRGLVVPYLLPSGPTYHIAIANFRYWLLATLSGLLPFTGCSLAVWRKVRRNRRIADRVCPACKYNLTGNMSGVCPECGMAVAGKGGGGV